MNCSHIIALLLLVSPIACFSQVEINDSISSGRNTFDGILSETTAEQDRAGGVSLRYEYLRASLHPADSLFSYRFARPFNLATSDLHFTPGRASLFHWTGGELVASGGTRTFPGLMRLDSGTIGIYQSIGNFSFYVGGMANKYGFFNGLHTQYGLGGQLSYQFSPRLSATLFGDYYFGQAPRMSNGMPMPPAIIGYYGRSSFGGYVDFQISERWGVQTGVQAVQQLGTNRYKAEPIVTPYYKISKKVSIGLPVGQILYHVLTK